MCAVNFVSHQENAFILIGRFVIWHVCFFFKLICIYPFIRRLKISITSSSLAKRLEFKSWLKKPPHDDIIEAEEIYIQLSFEIFNWKLE